MGQRPTPPASVKALLQTHGLAQPSAAFSASLTQLVVARYVLPRKEPFRASTWLGKMILLVLASLSMLVTYAVPIAVSIILAIPLAAMVMGTGSLLWLLEHDRKRRLQQETVY